ncbi:hypothetical protein B1R27_15210 [Streptomyces sp. GKU 895]|nr:hypothetical protein B1R27_15210 [Streptomyces sp. GKU 895]
MPGTDTCNEERCRKAPWIVARSAQAAIAVATVADVFRAATVRDRYLRPTDASPHAWIVIERITALQSAALGATDPGAALAQR